MKAFNSLRMQVSISSFPQKFKAQFLNMNLQKIENKYEQNYE